MMVAALSRAPRQSQNQTHNSGKKEDAAKKGSILIKLFLTYSYCIQTASVENESGCYTGLDMNAIGLVIDADQIENKLDCKVNEDDAFLGEIGDQSYLCWTISSEVSCVIEYRVDTVQEPDIIRMAESIPKPVTE